MRTDWYTKAILTVIAALLATLAFRPILAPPSAQAQNDYKDFYIEPGFTSVRKPGGDFSMRGKILIDRKNGDIWGFPTGVEGPYPIDFTSSEPPVSKPLYLGKFDFSKMKRVP